MAASKPSLRTIRRRRSPFTPSIRPRDILRSRSGSSSIFSSIGSDRPPTDRANRCFFHARVPAK